MPEELPALPPPEPTSVQSWLSASVRNLWQKAEKAILSLRALSFPGLVLSGFPAYFLSPVLAELAKFSIVAPAVMFSGIVFGTIDVTSVEKIKEIAVGNAGVLGGGAGALGLFLIFQQWYRMSRVLKHLRVGEIFEAFQNFLYVFAPLITVGFWSWILTFGLPTIIKSYVIPLVLALGGAAWVMGDTLNIEGFVKANLGVAAVILGLWFVVLGYTHKYVVLALRLVALVLRGSSRVFMVVNPETVAKVVTYSCSWTVLLTPVAVLGVSIYHFWREMGAGVIFAAAFALVCSAVSYELGGLVERILLRPLARLIARLQGRSSDYTASLEAKWAEADRQQAETKKKKEEDEKLAQAKRLETPEETSARWKQEAAEREAREAKGEDLQPTGPFSTMQ
jgi:hypothetical protein